MSDFDELTEQVVGEGDVAEGFTPVVEEEEVDEIVPADAVEEDLGLDEDEEGDEDDDEKDIQNLMWEASYGDRE